jgi:hypothetical protein
MSVSLTQPETYQCAREACDQTRTEATSVGSYCSHRCHYLATGRELLKHIRQDHRFCAGCYRQLKEIERPPAGQRVYIGPVDHEPLRDTVKNCLVGYEYITEHGELGQRSRSLSGTQNHVEEDVDAVAPADQWTVSGVVCSCGTTDTRDSWVRDAAVVSIEAAAHRLCDLLELLGREGQHDKTVHAPTLLETVQAGDEVNWQLAVGRAIDADGEGASP